MTNIAERINIMKESVDSGRADALNQWEIMKLAQQFRAEQPDLGIRNEEIGSNIVPFTGGMQSNYKSDTVRTV